MKAAPIGRSKTILAKGEIVELVVRRVSAPAPPSQHGFSIVPHTLSLASSIRAIAATVGRDPKRVHEDLTSCSSSLAGANGQGHRVPVRTHPHRHRNGFRRVVGDYRSMKVSPSTSTSIFVRRKQSIASSGLHTTGSFSLKLVLSTIGTPVISPKVWISRA